MTGSCSTLAIGGIVASDGTSAVCFQDEILPSAAGASALRYRAMGRREGG